MKTIGEVVESVSGDDLAKAGVVVAGAAVVAGIAVAAHRAITRENTEAHKQRMQAMKDNDIKEYESSSSVGAKSDDGSKAKSGFSFGVSR